MIPRLLRFVPLAILLVALAACAGCTGTETSAASPAKSYTDLSVEEFRAKIDETGGAGKTVIIDVRTETEYNRERLRGAINHDVNAGVFRDRAARLDRDTTYLLYCQSGTRSARAAQIMGELGFGTVYNMRGGIARWKDAGYPVIRGE